MFLKMSSFCAAESQLLVVVGCFQKSFSKLLQPFSHTHVPTLSILPYSLSLYLISLKSSLSLSLTRFPCLLKATLLFKVVEMLNIE